MKRTQHRTFLNIFVKEQETDEYFVRYDELHQERTYSLDNYLRMLESAGFMNVKVYADFTDEAPTETSERWFLFVKEINKIWLMSLGQRLKRLSLADKSIFITEVARVKACGIIVEYNPFHNGHRYHAQQARQQSGAEVVIAIMSGNFTKRRTSLTR